MAIAFSTTCRNNMLDEVTALIDADASAGQIKIYDGTRPATGAAVTTQTLLAELTFSTTSAAAASGGVLTFSSITADSSANATGTASWARVLDGASAFVFDCGVGATGSGQDIELNTTSIVSGESVTITSWSITAGNP